MTRPAPVFILGCPRSGTLLMSRILGLPDGHYLITEHKNKDACREDRSGINDSKLWWNTFEFEGWNEGRDRPAIEEPVYDAGNLQRLRSIYQNLAGDNRLIVKNPSNLARIPLIREMFPDAIFLFCIRNPWQTIASIAHKGVSGDEAHDSFHLRTRVLSGLANDFLLRAVHSWAESLSMYLRHRDDHWLSVRYEDIVANPEKEIGRLYTQLGIDDPASLRKAVAFPRHGAKSCYAINQTYLSSPHRQKMDELLQENASAFGYAGDFSSLNISRLDSYREKFTRKQIKRNLNRIAGDVVERLRTATAG
jgi:hypothetical protein